MDHDGPLIESRPIKESNGAQKGLNVIWKMGLNKP